MNNKSLLKRALKIQYDNVNNKVLKTIERVGKILQLPQAAIVADYKFRVNNDIVNANNL